MLPTQCCVLLTGEDLLAIAADQPFRFPATFTFVVRAFSGNTTLIGSIDVYNTCKFEPLLFIISIPCSIGWHWEGP